jgi:ubiquinone/menaquinone biosynthesis C-methylase UbiE
VAAAHLVHEGKSVDCYPEIGQEYADRLDLQPSDRVLEVGCGSGCLLLELKPRVAEIVGVDFAQDMLRHLDGTGVETHCSEAQDLPFPSASFDKVYCHGVVQYFPDEAYATEAVLEMLRVCRPGGRVLVGDVINGLLEHDYRRAALQAHHRGIARLRWLLMRFLLRPLYHRLKFGTTGPAGPLFLTPFFFKNLLAETPHRWLPLLETVETKPIPFLRYRFDVLIHKAEQGRPAGDSAT